MYIFVNDAGEPKHPDPNVQSFLLWMLILVAYGMPTKEKNKYSIN